MNTGDILVYKNTEGSIKIDVQLQDENVWLTQAQMQELFQKPKATISEHIENVFNEWEEIEILIEEFQEKIESFFDYVKQPENGRYIIAKMKDTSSTFDDQEIYSDFEKIYMKFVRRNRTALGAFFIKETKGFVKQLCDDFEKEIKL